MNEPIHIQNKAPTFVNEASDSANQGTTVGHEGRETVDALLARIDENASTYFDQPLSGDWMGFLVANRVAVEEFLASSGEGGTVTDEDVSGALDRAEIVLDRYREGRTVTDGLASNTIMELRGIVRRVQLERRTKAAGQRSWLTPEWCVEAWHRVNPGARTTVPYMPSLYLLDFARAVYERCEAQSPVVDSPARRATGGTE